MPPLQNSQNSRIFGLKIFYVKLLVILLIIFIGIIVYLSLPSHTFPSNTIISVQSGESLSGVAKDLKAHHIIKSSLFFQIATVLFTGNEKVIAGDYYFNQPVSQYTVISHLVKGKYDLLPIRVTVPEGLSMSQIAVLLKDKLSHFSVADFMKYSPAEEGYLFPDTYFFMPNITASSVIEAMHKNFDEHIKNLQTEITLSGRSEKDIITMASILETEGQNNKDWQIIAGILWKRLKMGMPLQVDSTLKYLNGKTSSELTLSDLKVGSPYNTYVQKGLPPTPIANPGLDTITAALEPTSTPYLYYLSDKDGVMHYASTFALHVINRQKYLR